MAAKKHHSILAFLLIIILFVNLVNVQSVLADGENPPEPPAATEVVTEEATEPPVEATSVPVESMPAPVETEATASPVAEILTEVPASTEVVVIDENGNSVPLAAEEAAEAVQILDPMWCPAGVLPGGAGCSQNFDSVTDLVVDMAGTPSFYDEHGIIYFMQTTGNQVAGSFTATSQSLGNSSFNTLKNYNLTLQGGWNGQNLADATFTGVTNFGSNALAIGSSGGTSNLWVGNITIRDFQFNGVSTTHAITVLTNAGNITLDDVDVLNQVGNNNNTALLSSNSGNIVVQNGSTFDGNGTDSNGFNATAKGSNGSITISDTSFTDVVRNGSANHGATLSASTITLTNVTATNNDRNGISISNAKTVTLNNVFANNNGTVANNIGSGVFIGSTLTSPLIINGGSFNNNGKYGVEVLNTTYVQWNSSPTCTGNVSGCFSPLATADSTPPVITPVIAGTAGSNGWYQSNVTVSWNISDSESNVPASSVCSPTTLTAETAGTTLTCSASNNVGLSGTGTVTIKIDKTPPTAALSIIGGTLGNNGWYVSDVTVQTSGTDSVSTPVTCTGNQTFSTDTAGTVVNGSCTNAAGLATNATPITVKIDKTAPTLSLPGTITAQAMGPSGANVTYSVSASDNFTANIVASCSPVSGSMFPLGSTTVNCSSSVDEAGNIGNGSFQVVVQDTGAPVIEPLTDIYAETNSSLGAFVFYPTPTATDIVDLSVPVTCSPASRSRFPLGASLVACTATDSGGNTATSYFVVYVDARERDTASSNSGSPAFIIPLTGVQIMDLDCNSVFWAFGIKLSYLNLCDQQTSVHRLSASDLPGALPDGFSYVMGLEVTVLSDGQILEELPNGTGLEMDFPLYKESADQFVVMYWNDSQGQWTEISKEISKNQISEILKTGNGDELYRLTSTDTAVFFPILTTNRTGIYVLAKK